jgi:hypothetical protein
MGRDGGSGVAYDDGKEMHESRLILGRGADGNATSVNEHQKKKKKITNIKSNLAEISDIGAFLSPSPSVLSSSFD